MCEAFDFAKAAEVGHFFYILKLGIVFETVIVMLLLDVHSKHLLPCWNNLLT